MKGDLEKSGFVCNIEKSQWTPKQTLTWLGFHLDLGKHIVSVPDNKIESLQKILMALQDCHSALAKLIAKVVGKIISMGIVLGPVTRLITHSLYEVLAHRKSWYQTFPQQQERN